jgi:hypothetical protein
LNEKLLVGKPREEMYSEQFAIYCWAPSLGFPETTAVASEEYAFMRFDPSEDANEEANISIIRSLVNWMLP